MRVRQIITNFLSNALKFTKEGSICVKVWQVSRKGSQSVVRIEVCDTGIGIRHSDLASIFEPYRQTKLSCKKQQGSGLGLSICLRLAELMGGRVGCRSILGEGSTFWVELPFEVLSTDKQRKSLIKTVELPVCKWKSVKLGATRVPDIDRTDRDFFKKSIEELKDSRVLVVDDNKINRELIKLDLVRLGHSVDLACDGLEAVRRAAQFSYDMILMDLELPELTGFEAARQIKQMHNQSRRYYVPIIAWTANTLEGLTDDNSSGFSGYFSKRYQIEELELLCQKHIGQVENYKQSFKPAEFIENVENIPVEVPELSLASADGGQAEKKALSSQKWTIPTPGSVRFSDLCSQAATNSLACDLLKAFVSDTDQLLSELEVLIGKTERAECGTVIHQLKGSFSFLGLEGGFELCQEAERLIRADSWPEAETQYIAIKSIVSDYISQARSALRREHETVSGSI